MLYLSGRGFFQLINSNDTYLCDVWCFAVFILLQKKFPTGTTKLYCIVIWPTQGLKTEPLTWHRYVFACAFYHWGFYHISALIGSIWEGVFFCFLFVFLLINSIICVTFDVSSCSCCQRYFPTGTVKLYCIVFWLTQGLKTEPLTWHRYMCASTCYHWGF